ncbi:MAG: electron transport complex subunit RsxA [Gammaproteobacteria bacterium]|nr:MAG: electron transport complex subunit RsxA [Gammaproteobacteria bacterium]
MQELALIVVATALINNVVLVQFLGLCPFMGVSGRLDAALGMGIATAFVLTLAAMLAHLVENWLLAPFGLDYLRTLSFILVIAIVVQFTEITIRRRSPLLQRILGIYLPLITSNCAVLGVALLGVNRQYSLLEAMLFGFGAALGFTLVLILFSALRERLDTADVPAPFRGSAIALISAGILSLAFMGFQGMV